jgi:hypothetical protein
MGMALSVVNWIMGCIQSKSFAILIKWSPFKVLQSFEGPKARMSMSSFLFLIIVETPSKVITEAKEARSIRGVKVSKREMITHLLFVDDVFKCTKGSLRDISTLKGALD